MDKVFHITPSPFDLNSLCIIGLSAKVGANPIGRFGTGLKYALAVLLREGQRVIFHLHDKGEAWEVVALPIEFRGQEAQQLALQYTHENEEEGVTTIRLPFTLNYAQNWTVQMAYRELESNTRDEGGFTDQVIAMHEMPEGLTIEVQGQTYYDVAKYEADDIFLPRFLKPLAETAWVDVYERDTDSRYYRGIRAGAFGGDRSCEFTFNMKTECRLSEEREVAAWDYDYHVAEFLSKQCEDVDLIRRILESADEGSYIEGLEFASEPSDAFIQAVQTASFSSSRLSSEAKRVLPKNLERLSLEMFPKPWRVSDSFRSILAANNKVVATGSHELTTEEFKALMAAPVEAINAAFGFAAEKPAEAPQAPEAVEVPEGTEEAAGGDEIDACGDDFPFNAEAIPAEALEEDDGL